MPAYPRQHVELTIAVPGDKHGLTKEINRQIVTGIGYMIGPANGYP
jgi:hypothetical protein